MNRTQPIPIIHIISSRPRRRITIDSDEIDILQLKEHLKKSFEPEQSPYTTNMFTFLDELDDDGKKRYHEFLKICDGALKDFQRKKVGEEGYDCCSYYVENSEPNSLKTFLDIAANYKRKYGNSILRYEGLLFKNRKTIGARSQDNYYEKKSKEQILKLLCERHTQLGIVKDDSNKSPELRRYYEQEYERESIFFRTNVSQTGNESILNCESLPSTLKLHEMADFIQFFKASFFAFKDTPEQTEIEVGRVINFLLSGNEVEKKDKVTRLLTFLPLELFNIDTTVSPKSITLNRDRFKAFLIDKGPQHLNLQQYMLGLGSTLRSDFSFGWPHLFMNLTSNFDIKSPNIHTDWNLWFNLFGMFIFSYSAEKVFPLMIVLPASDERVYNEITNSYSFVTSVRYSSSALFNSRRHFIGVHFIRYLKMTANGVSKPAILPIFTFQNDEVGPQSTQYAIYSMYDSKEEAVFNTDFFIARVENDEIFSRMSITHQELYHTIKYFGLRTYIVGDDRTKLYLTRRDESSPALRNLISLLDMKRVIVKFFKDSDDLFRSFTVIDFKDARPEADIYPLQGPPLDFTEIENTSTPTNHPPPDNSAGTNQPPPDNSAGTNQPQPDTSIPANQPQPDTSTPANQPQPDTSTPTSQQQPLIKSDDELISMGERNLYIAKPLRERYDELIRNPPPALRNRIKAMLIIQEARRAAIRAAIRGGGKKTKKILKLKNKHVSRKPSKKMSTQKQKKNKTKIKKPYKTQKTKK